MRKLHFGCGGMNLDGWENYDIEVDLRKPLPFPDGCASRIFAEHVVEHIAHQQAWNFFEECWRVLGTGGVVRIAVPDVARMWTLMNRKYCDAVQKGGHGDGSQKSAIKAAIFEHGHQAVWTMELLFTILSAIGFRTRREVMGHSSVDDLLGIEQHGKTVGEDIARVETSVVEGVKP